MSTLKDIAKRSGVSMASVSRVLNQDNSFSIAPDTRKKILQAALDLDYKSNHVVLGSMSKQASPRIAIVMLYNELLEIADAYYLTLRVHAKEEASRRGCPIKEFFISKPADGAINFTDFAAILVIGDTQDWYRNEPLRQRVIASGLPTVFVDFDPSDSELEADCVINDFRGIVDKALEHFIGCGFTRLAYAGSQGYNVRGHKRLDLRCTCFVDILKAQGLYHAEYIYIDQKHSFAEDGYKIGMQISEAAELPQCIFCENDAVAIGVLRALRDCHISVPEQISVIGCNDIPTAKFLTPPLSSVSLNSDLIGIMSVVSLLGRVDKPRELGVRIMVPNKLVLRASSK